MFGQPFWWAEDIASRKAKGGSGQDWSWFSGTGLRGKDIHELIKNDKYIETEAKIAAFQNI